MPRLTSISAGTHESSEPVSTSAFRTSWRVPGRAGFSISMSMRKVSIRYARLLHSNGGAASAQDVLLDLSRRRLRKLRDERGSLRHLEAGEPLPREVPQLILGQARPGLEDNERVRRFAPLLVRQPDDGHFLHGRMA